VKRLFYWTAAAVLIGGGLSLCLQTSAVAQFPPAPGTGPGLAETIEAIDSARVTTRILYVTAHPTMNQGGAYLLSRGLHAEVVLLSLTRGEAGRTTLARTSSATGIDPDAGAARGHARLWREIVFHAGEGLWLFENT